MDPITYFICIKQLSLKHLVITPQKRSYHIKLEISALRSVVVLCRCRVNTGKTTNLGVVLSCPEIDQPHLVIQRFARVTDIIFRSDFGLTQLTTK